jgi:uncharacterized protein YsxB (DUF464 family)
MININVDQKNGEMTISIKGHANYDQYGKDIVCAGVSAIAQTAVLGLESIAENYPDHVKINFNSGQ